MAKKESELKQKPPRGTKSKLLREYPRPDLRITPLSNTQSLNDFVDRFAKIEALTIKLLPTNQEEIDNDDFWKDLGRRKDEMNSNSATVKFSNGKDGLNPTEVVAQTSSATGMGNSTVQLVGHDLQGDLLKGDNEDFNLRIEVPELPKDVPIAVKVMQGTFNLACQNGFIKLPELAAAVLTRVQSLIRSET